MRLSGDYWVDETEREGIMSKANVPLIAGGQTAPPTTEQIEKMQDGQDKGTPSARETPKPGRKPLFRS